MNEKYKNQYRIESNRLKHRDYSSNGLYYITIVTQHRVCNLGEIAVSNGSPVVQLSDFGNIVNDEWKKSFEIRNELFSDEYIIMPNHIHAIVEIKNNSHVVAHGNLDVVETHGIPNDVNVETHGRASKHLHRLPRSISSFIAGFKSAVNQKIDDYIDKHHLDIPKYNRYNHFFQPNYHDHIIRDEQSYKNISEYIINNPANWTEDKFFE